MNQRPHMKCKGPRRRALIAGAGMLAAHAKAAEFYEGKAVAIICGYDPGGGVDLGTRLIAQYLGAFLPGAPRLPNGVGKAHGLWYHPIWRYSGLVRSVLVRSDR